MSQPRHIIILALRRSGTTALWRLFRQDPLYTCYDEPFSVRLRDLPAEHPKGVRREFIALFERDPERFREVYAPIPREEEVTRGLTPRQRAYLRHLLRGGPVVTDVTRCHGKIEDLCAEAPGAVLVHLYRRPAAFVTSHLNPSEGVDPLRIRTWVTKRVFFRRRSGFGRWGMEELLRSRFHATTARLMSEVGVELPPRGSPAALLLMAYWLGCYRMAEREGVAYYGDRFVSLSFETFCREPRQALEGIRDMAGAPPRAFDYGNVRQPRGALLPDSLTWHEFAREAGFSEEEINRLL